MAKKTPSRMLSGDKLTKATAEQVFGWKNVRKHDGELIGKKQDRAGRWRKAKVPDYAGDQRNAYTIDDRVKQLGSSERYMKELSRITKANNLPPEWATPEQRCRAALQVNSGHLRLVRSSKAASR